MSKCRKCQNCNCDKQPSKMDIYISGLFWRFADKYLKKPILLLTYVVRKITNNYEIERVK